VIVKPVDEESENALNNSIVEVVYHNIHLGEELLG